jgi:hypothetical protein
MWSPRYFTNKPTRPSYSLDLVALGLEDPKPEPIATAKSNPYGNPSAFRKAAKEGRFPIFKYGRARGIGALWSDVEAAIRAQRCTPPPRATSQEDQDRAELEAAGLRLGKKHGP